MRPREAARGAVYAVYPENLAIETLAPVGLMAPAPTGETGSLALQNAEVSWGSSKCAARETCSEAAAPRQGRARAAGIRRGSRT